MKAKTGRKAAGSRDEDDSKATDSSEEEESARPQHKRERSNSASSAPARKKHRGDSSLPTPRPSKNPPTTSHRSLSASRPDSAFLPSLTAFLTALSPSLAQFAPILLALGVDSLEAIVELHILEEAELERLAKLDRRSETGREGSRSLMELPPLERAKLKSSLKKAKAAIEAGVVARPSL
jgi:hypothetical protein